MNLWDAPVELFKSETNSLHFANLSFVHFVFGPLDSFDLVSFY